MSTNTLERIIEGNWHEIKGKLRATWGKLTHDEIAQVQGEAEQLRGLLEKKYGYTKDQADKQIANFTKENGWQ
jgi:uncharacterized protein YjbJ (UPF0337 family)